MCNPTPTAHVHVLIVSELQRGEIYFTGMYKRLLFKL